MSRSLSVQVPPGPSHPATFQQRPHPHSSETHDRRHGLGEAVLLLPGPPAHQPVGHLAWQQGLGGQRPVWVPGQDKEVVRSEHDLGSQTLADHSGPHHRADTARTGFLVPVRTCLLHHPHVPLPLSFLFHHELCHDGTWCLWWYDVLWSGFFSWKGELQSWRTHEENVRLTKETEQSTTSRRTSIKIQRYGSSN